MPVTVELEREVGDEVVDGSWLLLLLVTVVTVDEGLMLPGLGGGDDSSVGVDVTVSVGIEGAVVVSNESVGSEMGGVTTGSLIVSGGKVVGESLEPGKDGVELFETALPCRWRIPKRRIC